MAKKDKLLKAVSKKTPYYWRVKAIDNASNEGPWSEAKTFYSGFIFSFEGILDWPRWLLVVLIIGAVLVVAFIGFLIGRASSYGY